MGKGLRVASSTSASKRKALKSLNTSSRKKSAEKTPESDYQKQRPNDANNFYGSGKKKAKVVNSYISNRQLNDDQIEDLMQYMNSDDSFS